MIFVNCFYWFPFNHSHYSRQLNKIYLSFCCVSVGILETCYTGVLCSEMTLFAKNICVKTRTHTQIPHAIKKKFGGAMSAALFCS